MNKSFYAKLLIGILLLISPLSQAQTLKTLAQLSNALLVLNEYALNQETDKACQLSVTDISAKSQNLKSQIDEKIKSLSEVDFKILNQRLKSCATDCTCDIYAYAYEARQKPDPGMAEAAAKTKMADRMLCLSATYKKICSNKLFKKL